MSALPDPSAATGVERIAEAFASARADGRRAALMPYLMGGFPDLDTSARIGVAYAESGADLIELGVPFSDPLADGPVIHAAGTAALRGGATLPAVLEVAAEIAAHVPVVVMCYSNPILARGLERFLDGLVAAGVSGLIVPDLPLEEATDTLAACDARGLALVPLVAPTTPEARLAAIGARARGFVYAVSVTGTTGERARLDTGLQSRDRARGGPHRGARRGRVRDRNSGAGGRRRGCRRRRSDRRDQARPSRGRRARSGRRDRESGGGVLCGAQVERMFAPGWRWPPRTLCRRPLG